MYKFHSSFQASCNEKTGKRNLTIFDYLLSGTRPNTSLHSVLSSNHSFCTFQPLSEDGKLFLDKYFIIRVFIDNFKGDPIWVE